MHVHANSSMEGSVEILRSEINRVSFDDIFEAVRVDDQLASDSWFTDIPIGRLVEAPSVFLQITSKFVLLNSIMVTRYWLI